MYPPRVVERPREQQALCARQPLCAPAVCGAGPEQHRHTLLLAAHPRVLAVARGNSEQAVFI